MASASATQKLDEMLAGQLGLDNFRELTDCVYDSYTSVDFVHGRVRQMRTEMEDVSGEKERELAEKTGILQFAMGEYEESVALLEQVRTRKSALYFLGWAYLRLGREREALVCLEKVRSAGEDMATDLLIVEAHLRLRDIAKAEELLKRYSARRDESADLQCAFGRLAETKGEYGEAMALYEAALEQEPEHAEGLFRLALNCDLNGDDERAISLYEQCINLRPTYVAALMNLGILYEDHDRYGEAMDGYKRVLAIDPRHKRAQLYLKDAESSLNMYIDVSRSQHLRHMQEVYNLPVSSFELSARSRNALERKDIKTLGELTQASRDELLNEKNFGDTSLGEIEQLLNRYDLELGERIPADVIMSREDDVPPPVPPEKLNMSIDQLELCTRSRKCMDRLGIASIGKLLGMTEAELLACPNFGNTSLDEVRTKLTAHGLTLKSE